MSSQQLTCFHCHQPSQNGSVHDGKFICRVCSPDGVELKQFTLKKHQKYQICETCGYNTLISSSATSGYTTTTRSNCINPDCSIKNHVSTHDGSIDD